MVELKIQDDEAYDRSLAWLREKAALMEDPLIEDDYRSRIMEQYNVVEAEIQKYRRAEIAHKYPDLRRIYEELGWEIAEFPPAANRPEVVEDPHVEPEPAQLPEELEPISSEGESPKQESKLSAWFDDDD